MQFEQKNPIIFIISGKSRVGKDTVARYITKKVNKQNKKSITLQYSSKLKEYARNITDWDGSDVNKPRELLQYLGTDVIRKNIDDLFFIRLIIDDIKVYSYFFDAIIVSDARFIKELEIPKTNFNQVVTINVRRNIEHPTMDKNTKNHSSELDLDDYDDFDFIIENYGTLLELEDRVNKILEELML